MSTRRVAVSSDRFWRAAIFAAASAVAAAVTFARADEPPTEQGITAAKRDFSEVKAATGQGTDVQKLALPNTMSPAIEFKADLGVPLLVPPTAAKNSDAADGRGDAKSKNWLVDAMMAQPQGVGGKSQKTPAEHRTARLPVADNLESAIEESKRDEKSAAVEQKPMEEAAHPPHVVNPLQSYLAAWMTPQDFALLKPTGTHAEATAAGLPTPFGTSAIAESGEGLSEFSVSDSGTNAPAVELPGAASVNPYLAAFATPLNANAPATAPAPITTEPAFPPANPSSLAAPQSSAPPTAVPPGDPAAEFKKAQDDAKYFKQLKRF